MPNVLLLILDTVRAQNLSLYGYARATSPRLDRLAREGVVFDRAIAPSSWTLPSHASFFTGRQPHELSADWEVPLDGAAPTLAEALGALGYRTAAFVANFSYATTITGIERGFAHYDDEPLRLPLLLRNARAGRGFGHVLRRLAKQPGWLKVRKTATEVTGEFLAWLDREPEVPFFAFLNYFDAHNPYYAPPEFRTRFSNKPPGNIVSTHATYTDEEARQFETAYDHAILYIDSEMGKLVDTLAAQGRLDNTILIVTSDHGEQFGERRLNTLLHGNSLYLSTLAVPLLIRFPPDVPKGVRASSPVSLRDLPATVMDLIGRPDATAFPGRSLARAWGQPGSGEAGAPILSELSFTAAAPPWHPVSRGSMKSLVGSRLHYILNGDGGEELYATDIDPWERFTLIDSARYAPQIDAFRAALGDMFSTE